MKALSVVVFALFLVTSAFSNAYPLFVKFKILDESGNKLKNATIKVYKGNFLISSAKSKSSKVKLDLKPNAEYTIEVKLNNYEVKRISIDTHSDDNLLENKYSFFVELEHKSKYRRFEFADDFLDYPAAKVEYQPEEGVFDFNRTYAVAARIHKKNVLTEGALSQSTTR